MCGKWSALTVNCDLRTRSWLSKIITCVSANHALRNKPPICREGTGDFCLLAMAKIDGSAISRFTSILWAASGGKGECRVFYNGEHLNKQGIPKKICEAKIFWEEEQQAYKSKRRLAARENYLVATRQRKNRTQSRRRSANVGFFLKITEILRTLFVKFRELFVKYICQK